MPPPTRAEILARLRAVIAAKQPIIGAGAGIGLSAKSAAAGGADLIIIYNSGRFRMAGRGSLAGLMPYGDANAVVVDMAREVLPLLASTTNSSSTSNTSDSTNGNDGTGKGGNAGTVPVLAGVCATDPFRDMARFLRHLRDDVGFAGVQNFPTVGLIDGTFRAALEETGMGYGLEVEMIRLAASMGSKNDGSNDGGGGHGGLLTAPYVFDAQQAVDMTRAGADIVVAHMGLTTGGTIGAGTGGGGGGGKTLDECVALVQQIRDAAAGVRADVIVLCHGGPIAEVPDAEYVLARTRGVHGFFGASSMERLPVETAIAENARRFKAIRMGD